MLTLERARSELLALPLLTRVGLLVLVFAGVADIAAHLTTVPISIVLLTHAHVRESPKRASRPSAPHARRPAGARLRWGRRHRRPSHNGSDLDCITNTCSR